jgi:hypothetical protein
MNRINITATCLFLLVLLMSCNQDPSRNGEADQQEKPVIVTKPPATGNDSLVINTPGVVIFEPDSLQLVKIRQITKKEIFESGIHEFEFQSYTVKNYIKKNRPDLKILEAKNFRYLVFINSNDEREIIDLNQVADPWGMFLFNASKSPRRADMMSVDSEIPNFFKTKS